MTPAHDTPVDGVPTSADHWEQLRAAADRMGWIRVLVSAIVALVITASAVTLVWAKLATKDDVRAAIAEHSGMVDAAAHHVLDGRVSVVERREDIDAVNIAWIKELLTKMAAHQGVTPPPYPLPVVPPPVIGPQRPP